MTDDINTGPLPPQPAQAGQTTSTGEDPSPLPFTVTPSAEPDAKWWWGYHDEAFTGPFDTRAEVEADADSTGCMEDGCWLTQAAQRPVPLGDLIDGEDLLEWLGDLYLDSEHTQDGEEFPDATDDQRDDLTRRLRSCLHDWQAAHGIVLVPWCFNPVYVTSFWADWRLKQDFPSKAAADAAFLERQQRLIEAQAWLS